MLTIKNLNKRNLEIFLLFLPLIIATFWTLFGFIFPNESCRIYNDCTGQALTISFIFLPILVLSVLTLGLFISKNKIQEPKYVNKILKFFFIILIILNWLNIIIWLISIIFFTLHFS